MEWRRISLGSQTSPNLDARMHRRWPIKAGGPGKLRHPPASRAGSIARRSIASPTTTQPLDCFAAASSSLLVTAPPPARPWLPALLCRSRGRHGLCSARDRVGRQGPDGRLGLQGPPGQPRLHRRMGLRRHDPRYSKSLTYLPFRFHGHGT
jgi:hypothetical protein